MVRTKRRRNTHLKSHLKYSPHYKAEVALAAIVGDQTTAELASIYRVEEPLIELWKNQTLVALPEIFTHEGPSDLSAQHDLMTALLQESEQVRLALDVLEKNTRKHH
jgi:hypothetical protein